MRSKAMGKTTRLVAAAIFAAGLLAAPHPAAAQKPDPQYYGPPKPDDPEYGRYQCHEAFRQSPAKADGFCTHTIATHNPGTTGGATCTLDVRCKVVVPVSTGENAYVTFEERTEATEQLSNVDRLNLCLKPGVRKDCMWRKRMGVPTGGGDRVTSGT